MHFCRRAPYGARGLKLDRGLVGEVEKMSRPVWGAWIEILRGQLQPAEGRKSRPVWGAWIEMYSSYGASYLA